MPPSLRRLALAAALLTLACGGGGGGSVAESFEDRQIVSDFADQVVIPTYALLATRADALGTAVEALADDTSEDNLQAARDAWVASRQPWEQSEGFLFGPVESFGYDPAIDSWPVNETDLLAVLASGQAFTSAFVANLANTQKGFHTIEYLIFGPGGAKEADDLTARQLDYLVAITSEFIGITHQLRDAWTSGFRDVFAGAGNPGNTTYSSRAQAAEEILNGMAGICDEVANAKVADPFDAHDPNLVESQFSYNSILDFQDNIRSVENAYAGGSALAGTTGRGLSALVAERDPALDTRVKAEIQAAIAALGAIPHPFPIAITTSADADEIVAAQQAIRTLHDTIQGDLRAAVLE